MQVERQWKLLRLVPSRRNRRSTDELWNSLRTEVEYDGISKRTVERDLAFLQTMFPLEMRTEGRTNYWCWKASVNMWLPGITDEEALAFHMVENNMRDLLPEVSVERLTAYFDAAKARLTERPKGVRPWTSKFRIISSGVPRVARKLFNHEVSRTVRQALLDDKQLAISYFPKESHSKNSLEAVSAEINPLAVVQRDRELLLVYSLRGSREPQVIGLRDIVQASPLIQDFDGPVNFDVDNFLQLGLLSNRAELPLPIGHWIRLSVSLEKDEWERLCSSPLVASDRITHDQSGRTRLLMPIRFTTELAEWLLSLGPKVKVHSPPELRRWMAEKTIAAAEQYRGDNTHQQPQHVYKWFERWEDRVLTCQVCNWQGHARARELEPSESIRGTVNEFRCPGCGRQLISVDYSASTDEIVAHWDLLDESTRAAVLCAPERMIRFERDKLRSTSDLPDLKRGPSVLTWNLTRHKEGEISNSVRHGTKLIWIQLALWDGVEEFFRVAEILRQRYGEAINRIEISPEAMGFLGEIDSLTAVRLRCACCMKDVTQIEG